MIWWNIFGCLRRQQRHQNMPCKDFLLPTWNLRGSTHVCMQKFSKWIVKCVGYLLHSHVETSRWFSIRNWVLLLAKNFSPKKRVEVEWSYYILDKWQPSHQHLEGIGSNPIGSKLIEFYEMKSYYLIGFFLALNWKNFFFWSSFILNLLLVCFPYLRISSKHPRFGNWGGLVCEVLSVKDSFITQDRHEEFEGGQV